PPVLLAVRPGLLRRQQQQANAERYRRGDNQRGGTGDQGRVTAPPACQAQPQRLGVRRHRLVRQPVLNILRQVLRRRATVAPLPRPRLETDSFQGGGYLGGDLAWPRELPATDCLQDHVGIALEERCSTGQQVIERGPQTVHVAGRP